MKPALRWTLALAGLGVVAVGALALGAAGGRLDKPWARAIGDRFIAAFTDQRQPPDAGFRNTNGRAQIDCADFAPSARTAVIVTLGQSNAANQSRGLRKGIAGTANFNWFDGHCYSADDPLLGSDGILASPWTRLANLLVEAGEYDRVLIVPIAVSGSRVSEWTPDGRLGFRVVDTARSLRAAGLKPTHILWHQGESDSGRTAPQDYVRDFSAIVAQFRIEGWDAPVYAARATLCLGRTDPALNAAQASLPDLIPGVLAGPDTDLLDSFPDRHDRCHFTESGTDAHAAMWFEILTADAR